MRLIDARKLKKNAKFVRIDGELKAVVLYSDIMNAPTVDAMPVLHGRWIPRKESHWWKSKYYLCSNCNSGNGLAYTFNYCCNCGAKMGGERKGDA